MTSNSPPPLRRLRPAHERVTNVELFFDLVYVFAVTQLSHALLVHPTVTGALRTTLLLAMVWLVWVYTTWVTNFLDPDRLPVRVLLIALMAVSLVMSTSIPRAFGPWGLAFGVGYAVSQIGRSVTSTVLTRGDALHRNFERITAWCAVSGTLAVAGGFVAGRARVDLWLAAVAVDMVGGWVGFATPGLGRSKTGDWTIEGNHFAERCAAFILIALGESIVVIGATTSDLPRVGPSTVAAFVVTFLGAVALWWLYFDRSAEAASSAIARSADPGRLGRSAYHLIHPVMVAGIIVTAAGDARLMVAPESMPSPSTLWLVLGGTALFLAGHALFKAAVWRTVPWSRMAGLVALGLLALPARHLPAWLSGLAALAVVVGVIVADELTAPPRDKGTAG